MDDVISLSSGSDSDSDLEVVGCYSDDTREDTRPFIRTDWVAVKPVSSLSVPALFHKQQNNVGFTQLHFQSLCSHYVRLLIGMATQSKSPKS